MRGGTESVPLIVGLGRAAEIIGAQGLERWAAICGDARRLEQVLVKSLKCVVNGAGSPRLPETRPTFTSGLDGDALVTYLEWKKGNLRLLGLRLPGQCHHAPRMSSWP